MKGMDAQPFDATILNDAEWKRETRLFPLIIQIAREELIRIWRQLR